MSRRAGREVLLQKPLIAVEEIVILGNAVVTPALLKHCAQEGVGIHYLSPTGTYYAGLTRTPSKNAPARVAQFKAYLEPTWKLALAQRFVLGKIRNGLVFLRRNGAEGWERLKEALLEAERAQDEEALRGAEGRAADLYFRAFAELLPEEFAFGERSRRPPRDPANSLLSLAYTLLAKECESALLVAGLDPYVGYLHEVRYGRPSLALDLMEEFRSVLADSVVLSLLNNRRVTSRTLTTAKVSPSTERGVAQVLKGLGRATKRADTAPPSGKAPGLSRNPLSPSPDPGQAPPRGASRYEPFAVR